MKMKLELGLNYMI